MQMTTSNCNARVNSRAQPATETSSILLACRPRTHSFRKHSEKAIHGRALKSISATAAVTAGPQQSKGRLCLTSLHTCTYTYMEHIAAV